MVIVPEEMLISVELFILKLPSKMCLIENIFPYSEGLHLFYYCSIKIFRVKFLISQNKAKFGVCESKCTAVKVSVNVFLPM